MSDRGNGAFHLRGYRRTERVSVIREPLCCGRRLYALAVCNGWGTNASERKIEIIAARRGPKRFTPFIPLAKWPHVRLLAVCGGSTYREKFGYPLCLIKTFCAGKMNQCRYGVVSTLECCWGNERYSGLWLSENGRKSGQTTAIFRDV